MLALVVAAMVCTTRAEAFCVYNKSDVVIDVVQTKGYSSWGKHAAWVIDPGKKRCCNYKTKDCNKSQEKTAKVAFKVTRYEMNCSLGGCRQVPSLVCKKEIKAGGWLTIKGKSPDFSCRPHY